MTASVVSVLASVASVRRSLTALVWMRAALVALGAAGAAWLIVRVVSPPARTSAVYLVLMVLGVTLALVALQWRRRGRIDAVRAALWMEEQLPADFALVTLVERAVSVGESEAMHTLDSPTNLRLVDAYNVTTSHADAATIQARRALRRAALHQLRGPALFAFGIVAVLAFLRDERTSAFRNADSEALVSTRRATSKNSAPIGAWRVRIVPPNYAGLRVFDGGDAESVRALAGSRLELVGSGEVPLSSSARILTDSSTTAAHIAALATASGWQMTVATVASPTELRVTRGSVARLLLIDGYADSIPRVDLKLPARDSVLRRATGALPLDATLHDDLGLASAAFELIVSSGEGERFTVRTVRVGARTYAHRRDANIRDAVLRVVLNLDSLLLGPGDIIHLRAVARDAHPAASHEMGTSETRSFRIARVAEYDSIDVEPAPPPEVDKSLMSQRMLLLLTEKLDARRLRLARPVLLDESSKLARDQVRLRLAVGDVVFQRLGGASSAAHADGAADNSGPPVGKADLLAEEEGDDSPVVAINKPLLEAYNAMWDAGRALEQGDTKGAMPHMKVALAAIERSRAASRLYLRGKSPTVIVDLAKVRLTGRDTGITNARTARGTLSVKSALRETRLLAAAVLAVRNASDARDSIAVLRLESVSDAPDFARSLDALLAELRRGGDVTARFVHARRVLGGIVRENGGAWSRASSP